ncbi:MAG TPA: sulfite exporter TauE/SafE family protein [Candidatus Limnocylindrales bacterium]|nr:sulfite exporter TauE/SafE family protein [Candidatus Limnocylindrales bacterium]
MAEPGLIEFELVVLLAAVGAGAFGAVVGVGGGLILVPLLTGFLGVDIKLAIAASLLGVIAVSTTASTTYLARGWADRRLGLVLLVATASGGILGGYLAGLLDGRVLAGIFSVVLLVVAGQMARRRVDRPPPETLPGRFEFDSAYLEPTTGTEVRYRVGRVPLGGAISVGAGALSGLLGIGGGVVNVPTMNALMGVPIRVATSTSTYMLGATAVASAVLYYSRGEVDGLLAAPVVVGVLVGARVGARLAAHLPRRALQLAFALVALVFAAQMLMRGMAG